MFIYLFTNSSSLGGVGYDGEEKTSALLKYQNCKLVLFV